MPGKSRSFHGKRRGRRRESRRVVPQAIKSASTPAAVPSTPAITQPKPASQVTPAAKTQVKSQPELMLKITPVSELKRIGIIAGSMFVILFILAFILK